jgi:hypothetical protein
MSITDICLVIQCGHTVCSHCVSSSPNIQIFSCPVCRVPTWLHGKGSMSLKTNFALLEFLPKVASRKQSKTCGGCDEQPATHGCVECDTIFCGSCLSSVHKPKLFQQHQRLPISEFLSLHAVEIKLEVNAVPKCNIHKNEDVKLFCLACDALICLSCMVRGQLHHGHETKTVKSVAIIFHLYIVYLRSAPSKPLFVKKLKSRQRASRLFFWLFIVNML